MATALQSSDGKDQYGLTVAELQALVTHILQQLNSSKEADQLEGQVDQLLIATLTGVEVVKTTPSLRNPGSKISSKYDAETSTILVEVGSGKAGDKAGQLEQNIHTDAANYTPPRPIVIYAPNMLRQTAENCVNITYNTDRSLNVDVPVYVVTKDGVWYGDMSGKRRLYNNSDSPHSPEEWLRIILGDNLKEPIA